MKDARERRDETRKLVANGVNPSENRKIQKSTRANLIANSFEVIARETNPYGQYDSMYSQDSINNSSGQYGSRNSPIQLIILMQPIFSLLLRREVL